MLAFGRNNLALQRIVGLVCRVFWNLQPNELRKTSDTNPASPNEMQKASLNLAERNSVRAINMMSRFRKLTLLTHIIFSVGWFGAIAAYMALAIAGLVRHEDRIVRAAYLSMNLIGWFVIVPFSLAALLSGLLQSLSTQWGLFRHWWIAVKLVLTVVAVIILLRHMEAVSRLARMAAEATPFGGGFRAQQIALLVHPSGGLLVLLAAMTLSVFKPWGMTPYGRRRSDQTDSPYCPSSESMLLREPVVATSRPRWARIIGFHAIGLAVVFAILHITGLHHHH